VPARIVQWDDGTWQADLDGRIGNAHADPAKAEHVALIWQSGTIIEQHEYAYLGAVREHYAKHGPADHPSLHPRESISPMLLNPAFLRRTP
jgi:hypothetical protein